MDGLVTAFPGYLKGRYSPAAMQPENFGPYQVLFQIAAGGMAEVFAARHEGMEGFQKTVAVKRMLPALAHDEEFINMFLDEARMAASISSPYVVATRDMGRTEDGTPYMVMDLVVGVSLSELVADAASQSQPVPRSVAIGILDQAARGLHAAHEATSADGEALGLVHRDVSPPNILVGVDGRARVTDFGIAHAYRRRTKTQTGHFKGKFAYFSPEQALGQPLDRRSDVFSLSIVAWELLAGRRLFKDPEGAVAVLERVKSLPIPPLSVHRPDLPAGLVAVIAKGLSRDLKERYSTALEFATDLTRADREAGEGANRKDTAKFVRRLCRARLERIEAGLRGELVKDAAQGTEGPTSVRLVSTQVTPPPGSTLRESDRGPHGDAEYSLAEPHSPGAPTSEPPAVFSPGVFPARRSKALVLALSLAAITVPIGAGLWLSGALDDEPLGEPAPPVEVGALAPVSAEEVTDAACREWATGLVRGQQDDGSFATESHREAWGWTTGQALFALIHAHDRCETPQAQPLLNGLRALRNFHTPEGWTGGGEHRDPETPATAWATLTFSVAFSELRSPDLRSAELRQEALDGREILLRSQNQDGSFRFRPHSEPAVANPYSSVLALWALAEVERIAPSPDSRQRLLRARQWIVESMRSNRNRAGDGPHPLRATAGLEEQALWVLRRTRSIVGDAHEAEQELTSAVVWEVIARCELVESGCARPTYSDGETYLASSGDPDFLTLWHPWLTLLAHDLAEDPGAPISSEERRALHQIARWGLTQMEQSISSLAAAPSYKLAEYLFVVSTLRAAAE